MNKGLTKIMTDRSTEITPKLATMQMKKKLESYIIVSCNLTIIVTTIVVGLNSSGGHSTDWQSRCFKFESSSGHTLIATVIICNIAVHIVQTIDFVKPKESFVENIHMHVKCWRV